LDILVIGVVAVSKIGQRIGRGNGYVDLDFGILVTAGIDKTLIVATVHDEQV
jgi:5-formyltetrahydrofolate cyclo-ligase